MKNHIRLEVAPILLHGGLPVGDIEDLMKERLARRNVAPVSFKNMVDSGYKQRSCTSGMIANAGNPGANLGCPYIYHTGDRDAFHEIITERMRGVQDTALVGIALNRAPDDKKKAPNRSPQERCACLLRSYGAPVEWTPRFPSDWIEQALALNVKRPKAKQCKRCNLTIRCHRPGDFDGSHSCKCPMCKVVEAHYMTGAPCECQATGH